MLAFIVPIVAALSQSPPDKSSYTLFNPTPRELRREMSTDRPDATESPITVDAGHIQLEMSVVEFATERSGTRVDSWSIAPVNFKVGVLNNVDVQFLFDPFLIERERGQPELSGVGDLTVRAKVNLIGNDGGEFAAGIMPFVKIPTGGDEVSNGAIEGGVIVPASLDLGEGLSLGLMLELDFVRDGNGGYDTVLVHSAVLGRDLWGNLSGFVEYVGVAGLQSGSDYQAIVNAGVTYGLTPDVQLDGGIGVGLTDAAPDFAAFVGVSFRY